MACKRPRFAIIDGLAVFPVLFILVYPRLITLYFLLFVSAILVIQERRGIGVPMMLRKMRTSLVGTMRYIRPPWRRRDQ